MPIPEAPADELRQSPYQQQLERGFALLRFRQPLEAEFRQHLGRQARTTQRLGGLLLVLIAGIYLVLEHSLLDVSDYPWSLELILLRGLQMAVGGIVLIVSFRDQPSHAFTNGLLGTLLILVGMIASQIDLLYEGSGVVEGFRYGVGILVVCSFFYLGMIFWWAALCAALIVATDIALALSILPPELMTVHWVAVSYYLLLLSIGAIARYAHEYGQREQFLVRRLLGWMAEHDALTGLANRRSFDAALRRLVAQARREGLSVTLILVDLDEFKAYNDSLGHPAGDQLLRDFGHLLRPFARRPLDLAARVGGEEFALLLYDCDEAAARQIGEQLLEALRTRAFAHPASKRVGHVTASLGIALLEPGQMPERFYKRADDALYQAKQAGRDRWVVSGAAG